MKRCPAHDWKLHPERHRVDCARCGARVILADITGAGRRTIALSIAKRNPGEAGEALAADFNAAVEVAEAERLDRFALAEGPALEPPCVIAAAPEPDPYGPPVGLASLVFATLTAAFFLWIAAAMVGRMLAG